MRYETKTGEKRKHQESVKTKKKVMSVSTKDAQEEQQQLQPNAIVAAVVTIVYRSYDQ